MTAIITMVQTLAPAIHTMIDSVATTLQMIVNPVATTIQTILNAITFAFEVIRTLFVTVVTRPIGTAIHTVFDPITAPVKMPVDPITTSVQTIFDPVPAAVKMVFNCLARVRGQYRRTQDTAHQCQHGKGFEFHVMYSCLLSGKKCCFTWFNAGHGGWLTGKSGKYRFSHTSRPLPEARKTPGRRNRHCVSGGCAGTGTRNLSFFV
jgi:hypothetical protein